MSTLYVQNLDINQVSNNITFANVVTFNSTMNIIRAQENVNVVASAATGTINFDALNTSILYYTVNASANFTVNVRGDSTTSLNNVMANGQSITVVFINTNGATPYYNNVLQIDGSTRTRLWPYGSAPTTGVANSAEVYSYTIIKTASNTYNIISNVLPFS